MTKDAFKDFSCEAQTSIVVMHLHLESPKHKLTKSTKALFSLLLTVRAQNADADAILKFTFSLIEKLKNRYRRAHDCSGTLYIYI